MQRSSESAGLEMSLREALSSQAPAGSAPPPYPPAAAPHHDQHGQHPYPPSEGSPRAQHHHLDPNHQAQPMPYNMASDEQIEDGMSSSTQKGKRELSTSKRAAQNRAAQRAFRQRKEGYIKKLEEQVKDLSNMDQNYKLLQSENYQLREYILNLQSRLLENQSDFPPAPSHINLHAVPHPSGAGGEGSYSAEQQLRREMEQRHEMEQHQDLDQRRAPPAPVVAGEDPVQQDGISQLQAAAAQERAFPGSVYHAGRARTDPDEADGDAKPST